MNKQIIKHIFIAASVSEETHRYVGQRRRDENSLENK